MENHLIIALISFIVAFFILAHDQYEALKVENKDKTKNQKPKNKV